MQEYDKLSEQDPPRSDAPQGAAAEGGESRSVVSVRLRLYGNTDFYTFDIPDLKNEIEECEAKIDELTAALEGKRPRKAVGILPRDW